MLIQYKKTIATLNTLYRYIEFHGVYVQYSQSIKLLASLLNKNDAAELHYIMMHLSHLSYFKSIQGRYLWCSKHLLDLCRCDSLNKLHDQPKNRLEGFALNEFSDLEEAAVQSEQSGSAIIFTKLKGQGDFTCHAKVYPVYDVQKTVIGSLSLLAEVKMPREYTIGLEPSFAERNESALLV